MPSTISAGTTAGTAIAIAGDTSGVLQLQTNGTTPAVTIDTSQNVGVGVTTVDTTFLGGTYRAFAIGNGAGYGSFIGQTTATNTGASVVYLSGSTTGASGYRGLGSVGIEIDGTSTTNATGRIALYTGSGGAQTERMRINSSGYVTTPFQPAFQAISSGNITPGSGVTKVSFASVTPNISSSFSTSTSRFTAPVAGTYFFTGLVTYDTNGSASYVGCIFYRNGGALFSTYNGKATGQYGQVKNSLVVTLSAGDYMEMYTDTNSGSVVYEGGRTYFMGYLLG